MTVLDISLNNVVLTGFMGTGKSTIGRLVAEKMDRDFIDMDNLIETREGKMISEIFAEHGEPYFRQLEARLCQELSAKKGLVISTGGGTLVPEKNMRLISRTSLIICLDCDLEVLWQRVAHRQHRPLVQTDSGEDERYNKFAELFESRREAYRRIPLHLDVSYLPIPKVVERVCTCAQRQFGMSNL